MLYHQISGLYYKIFAIVIMTIVSDATIWSVTFDAARGVIYDRNMAIPHVYGTGVICDDRNSFIIQATGAMLTHKINLIHMQPL